jgi:hypothetical protein
MAPQLDASPVIFEFSQIMRNASTFPAALRPLQRLLIGTAVELVPTDLREHLSLDERWALVAWQRRQVRLVA